MIDEYLGFLAIFFCNFFWRQLFHSKIAEKWATISRCWWTVFSRSRRSKRLSGAGRKTKSPPAHHLQRTKVKKSPGKGPPETGPLWGNWSSAESVTKKTKISIWSLPVLAVVAWRIIAMPFFLLAVCSQKMCPEMVQRKGRHCVRDLPTAIRARIYGSTEVISVWDCSYELQRKLGDHKRAASWFSNLNTNSFWARYFAPPWRWPFEEQNLLSSRSHNSEFLSQIVIVLLCCALLVLVCGFSVFYRNPARHYLCFVQFLVLLFLRHFLPLLIGGPEQYSFTLFSLLALRTAGILLPVVVIVRTVRTLHHQCRRHQVAGEIAFSHRIQMHYWHEREATRKRVYGR